MPEHSKKREDTLQKLSEAQRDISGLAFGFIPAIVAWSKAVFEAVGHSFFMVIWVNDLFALVWQALSLRWAQNQNMHKSGNLLFESLKFALLSLIIFGAAILTGVMNVIALGALLMPGQKICLISID